MATPPPAGWPGTLEEPETRFDPDSHPATARALRGLQSAANINETTGALQYPRGNPSSHGSLVACLELEERETKDEGLAVLSFDIDLTLATGEQDEEGLVLIDPSEISRLQQLGYIVGTCSDREPSDQRQMADRLGQQPHFTIPKELLEWARRLLPGTLHLHVGDDPKRDRAIALAAGWTYQTPEQYTRTARGPKELWPGERNSQED